MALYPVAGMHIDIGDAPMADQSADFIASNFSSVNWIEIDGWSQMGAIGDGVNEITTPLINRGRDVTQKGTATAPAMENQFVVVPGDAGQTALIAAGQPGNKNSYPFRVRGNESGVSQVSQRLFVGLVMGTPEQGGGANTARILSASIRPISNIVPVAAVA